MFNKNDNEDTNQDLHLADSDYRHLNLPKHQNISLKEIIAQMQQSPLQPATEENASLFPFHINLAQADLPATPPAAVVPSQEAPVQNDAAQVELDVAEEVIDLEEELLAEDPGVLLLPDTIDEVIRIEIARDTKAGLIVVDDDGSQDLYRIKHNNNGLVQDEPRDLGLPPIEYPTQKLFVPFIPAQPVVAPEQEQECCSSQVEIKLTTKLIYLGEYCCGYEDEGGEEYLYSSYYGWEGEGEGGSCGCGCEPYNPPCPPTPNYTIVFNSCNGEQWLDLTICNSYGGETARSNFNAINEGGCGCGSDYQSSYDDCCTTYRIEIPASFGLDCECPILELKTDQLFIYSPWDLIYSNSKLFDCHGNCYEITTPYSSSGRFSTTDLNDSSSQFVLEECECESDQLIETILINNSCEDDSGSPNYTLSFSPEYRDVNNDNVNDYIVNFTLLNNGMPSGTASLVVDPNAGLHCPCLITEFIYDESQWREYVNSVTSDESALTLGQAFTFIFNNGFFEDCQGNCYELGTVVFPQESFTGIVACTDCEEIELNVTFACDGCDIYNRFQNWVANVAPGSFDPFQFFTDNVHFSLVHCNNTSFIEVNYLDINDSLGDGYYTTTEQTLRINLPEGFSVDDFSEVVVDPKIIYEAYQDSCYQFGYNIEDVLYNLLDNKGIYVINSNTGAEYVSIYDGCSGDSLIPANCEEAICINPVNSVCEPTEELFANIQANFNGSGCSGGECNTEYTYQGESYSVAFNFEFIHSEPNGNNTGETTINFNYSIGDSETDTYVIDASGFGLSCLNSIVNFIFDESDFVNHLNDVSLQYGEIQGFDLIDYFAQNGMFEDCEGNCFEINKTTLETEGTPTVSYSLQECTDCTDTPITVSIDDACNEVVTFNTEAVSEISDADKLAYFQNLYTLSYVDCNGASFVEFTYYYNNSDEGCEYNSFPACCETIRISIEDCCGGESGEETTSPITQLVLDCDFINDFFDNYFSDYCGNISYNIPQGWGSNFLNYIMESESEFKTEDGTVSYLGIDECGNYVIPSNCEACCIDVPVDITLNNAVPQPYIVVFNFFRPLTYTYTSDVDGNIYNGRLINTQAREDGLVVRTGDNDFTFNFTYTNCDINSDGTIDNFLTFQIDTKFTVTDLTISGNTSVISFENDPPLLEFDIVAPVNIGDCCSFTLMFDEKAFVDRLMTINRTLSPELSGQTILDTLITIGDASFTDCDDNQYVIVKNENNYSLQANTSGPVIFDLTGDGFNLTTVKQGVLYDVAGDSAKEKTAWFGVGNGLLIYDADQNHTVSNSSEFVLTDHVPGAKTDLEALRIGFDSNNDNLFDQQDAAWNLFGIWQDVNQDAVVDNGEYHSLAQMGIVSIGLNTEQGSGHIVNGNVIHGVTSFTWADGSTGKAADATLNYNDIVQDVHNNSTVTDPAVSNPTVAEQSHIVMAQNDPVVQSVVEQLANQAAVASA